MDYREAEFVRFIADHEQVGDLVDEAKAETWTKEREHAVLAVQTSEGHRFIMVRGGRDGIQLRLGEQGAAFVDVEGRWLEVVRLAWHVHPVATGPSDHDREVLDHLKQDSSMLYEIGESSAGTRFYAMSRRRT